jgi:hypothetical protein
VITIAYGPPRGRSETAWTVIDGQRHEAAAGGCAIHALCRVLRDAGIPDQPWEVPGRLKGTSIHWMADHYVREDDTGIRIVRWKAPPLPPGKAQKGGSGAADGETPQGAP